MQKYDFMINCPRQSINNGILETPTVNNNTCIKGDDIRGASNNERTSTIQKMQKYEFMMVVQSQYEKNNVLESHVSITTYIEENRSP